MSGRPIFKTLPAPRKSHGRHEHVALTDILSPRSPGFRIVDKLESAIWEHAELVLQVTEIEQMYRPRLLNAIDAGGKATEFLGVDDNLRRCGLIVFRGARMNTVSGVTKRLASSQSLSRMLGPYRFWLR